VIFERENKMTTLAGNPTNPQAVDRYIDTLHHFYASSFCTWKTGADMREVLAHMEKEGYEYTLWYVPVSNDSNYEIRYYAPQVEGSFVLGTFTPKKKARK
jgi:hypothetical protein